MFTSLILGIQPRKGYKLSYMVAAPPAAYWKFKTDWMNYPRYGGMRHYLHYMAHWEHETITHLIDRYR